MNYDKALLRIRIADSISTRKLTKDQLKFLLRKANPDIQISTSAKRQELIDELCRDEYLHDPERAEIISNSLGLDFFPSRARKFWKKIKSDRYIGILGLILGLIGLLFAVYQYWESNKTTKYLVQTIQQIPKEALDTFIKIQAYTREEEDSFRMTNHERDLYNELKTSSSLHEDDLLAIQNKINQITNLEARSAAYLNIGNSFFDLHEYGKAINYYNLSIHSCESNYLAWNNKSLALLKDGKCAEAISAISTAIKLKDYLSFLYANKALIYTEMDSLQAAVKNYDIAIKLNPTDIKLYEREAWVLSFSGQQTLALELINQGIEMNPQNPTAYILRDSIINRISIQDIGSPHYISQRMDSDQASNHLSKGILFYKKGMNQNALEQYTIALHLNPQYTDAYIYRGKLLSELGRFDEALSDFNKAQQIDSFNPLSYEARSKLYYQIGNRYQYFQDLGTAIKLGSKNPDVYIRYSMYLFDHGNQDETIKYLDMALKIDPGNANAYGNRGVLYFNRKEYDKALIDLDRSIDINPRSGTVYVDRGTLFWTKKQWIKGIEDFNKAIQFEPNDAAAYFGRHLCYDHIGEHAKAQDDLFKARELDPKNEFYKRFQ